MLEARKNVGLIAREHRWDGGRSGPLVSRLSLGYPFHCDDVNSEKAVYIVIRCSEMLAKGILTVKTKRETEVSQYRCGIY